MGMRRTYSNPDPHGYRAGGSYVLDYILPSGSYMLDYILPSGSYNMYVLDYILHSGSYLGLYSYYMYIAEIDRYIHKSFSVDVEAMATNTTCMVQTNATAEESCSCWSLMTVVLPGDVDCDKYCKVISAFVQSGSYSLLYHSNFVGST
jgi:hypothetical protein